MGCPGKAFEEDGFAIEEEWATGGKKRAFLSSVDKGGAALAWPCGDWVETVGYIMACKLVTEEGTTGAGER